MSNSSTVIQINSEAAAWATLKRLLSGEFDETEIELDLSKLDWAKAHFAYSGAQFDQTITPSIMKGLLEFQNSFYRSVALITKGDNRVTRLTDAEKQELELVFRVKKGSSDFEADAEAQVNSFMGAAANKMSKNQIFIAILVAILLYFGSGSFEHYVDNTLEAKKIESNERDKQADREAKKTSDDAARQERSELYDIIREISAPKAEQNSVLAQAYEQSGVAETVGENNREAIEEIIRNTGGAEYIIIQSTKITGDNIQKITKATRARAEKVVIKEKFRVVAVDAESRNGFTVKLENKNWTITAQLEDKIVGARYQRAISRAEWSKQLVFVHITGRKINGVIRDAKITKAFAPRSKSKSN